MLIYLFIYSFYIYAVFNLVNALCLSIDLCISCLHNVLMRLYTTVLLHC